MRHPSLLHLPIFLLKTNVDTENKINQFTETINEKISSHRIYYFNKCNILVAGGKKALFSHALFVDKIYLLHPKTGLNRCFSIRNRVVFMQLNTEEKLKSGRQHIHSTQHLQVIHYLDDFIKSCDPFKKIKIIKLQMALKDWADKNKFSLKKKSSKIDERQRKVLSKTFHGAGMVVPVDAKTKLGYRPLIETDENLKKICKLIIKASDESEKESLWENLQPLITAANIANDECDFGNSLELGINLFCMGSPVFHNIIGHLLSTAYLLLNRAEFEEIIKAHLKFRRKGDNMSLNNEI